MCSYIMQNTILYDEISNEDPVIYTKNALTTMRITMTFVIGVDGDLPFKMPIINIMY